MDSKAAAKALKSLKQRPEGPSSSALAALKDSLQLSEGSKQHSTYMKAATTNLTAKVASVANSLRKMQPLYKDTFKVLGKDHELSVQLREKMDAREESHRGPLEKTLNKKKLSVKQLLKVQKKALNVRILFRMGCGLYELHVFSVLV